MTREPLSLEDTIFIAITMLLGTEGIHYLIFQKGLDEWRIVGWLRRN